MKKRRNRPIKTKSKKVPSPELLDMQQKLDEIVTKYVFLEHVFAETLEPYRSEIVWIKERISLLKGRRITFPKGTTFRADAYRGALYAVKRFGKRGIQGGPRKRTK